MLRLALALIACTGSCLALPQTTSTGPAEQDPPPNIVYILADDLGYGDISCLNDKAAWKTVNVDRLAAEGMAFTDAHSGSAVCTPTRYGIITGRYAWRSRLKRGVLGGGSPHLIDPARMTVASLLHKQGYYTACLGKWHLGWDWAKKPGKNKGTDFSTPVTFGPGANGFDYYFCHSGSLDMAPYVWVENDRVTAAPDRVTENKDYQGFWRKGPTGADFRHEEVLEELTRRSVALVHARAKTKKPFFLYLPLPAPHTPILPTGKFVGKSGTNPYGDFVLQVDDTVGRVMAAVKEAGVARNTVFIFTSDNGCSPRAKFDELAKHGHHPSHVFRGHKADIYEGGHHVPFVVRWPAKILPGSRSDQLTCLTDLMRTCSDIVGVEIPDTAAEDSVSMLPAMLGISGATRLREAVVHHSVNGSFALRQGKWKLVFCPGSGGWSAPRPKAAKEQGLPSMQLFDLEADVGERNNLAAEHPEIVDRLTKVLAGYVKRGRSTPGEARSNEGKTRFLPAPAKKKAEEKAKKSESSKTKARSENSAFRRSTTVYKTIGSTELKLHLFQPTAPSGNRPAVIFFFGGGWRSGSPSQFFPHCEHLAARGLVAISAEYRVASRHKATPFDCVADARSAIRYLRSRAQELGIDSSRIIAGGGSAGGHLAAATATVPIPAAESLERKFSSRPDALVLFNPVFDNGPGGWGHKRVKDRFREISPIHNLDGKRPPTLVLLGTKDKLIPVSTAERYRDLMKRRGNRCELVLYEGQPHGFFNHRDGKNPLYGETVAAMDRFIDSLWPSR